MKKLYYKLCDRIGYLLILQHNYDPQTFEYTKYNRIILFKFIGKRDDAGFRKIKEIFQIQLKRK